MIGQLLSNTNEILQYVTVLNSEFGARATNMAGVAPVLIRLAIFARKKRNDGDLRRLPGEADKIRYFGRSDQMINQSRLPKPWDVQVLLPGRLRAVRTISSEYCTSTTHRLSAAINTKGRTISRVVVSVSAGPVHSAANGSDPQLQLCSLLLVVGACRLGWSRGQREA
jgi:hypothetical protein